MYGGLTLGGLTGATVIFALRLSLPLALLLAFVALRRAPESLLARVAFVAVPTAILFSSLSKDVHALHSVEWVVFPLQTFAVVAACVVLRRVRRTALAHGAPATSDRRRG